MENINDIQLKILSVLLFNPMARFKDLNIVGLTTDHFSYHIRILIENNLIQKDGTFYSLTSAGKIIAGRIDTDTHKLEKQAKIGVLVIPIKYFGKTKKFLIQERRKEPYFGYWGFPTGKIKFGSTVGDTANRELEEETGLKGVTKFCFEIHEMVYDKTTKEQL